MAFLRGTDTAHAHAQGIYEFACKLEKTMDLKCWECQSRNDLGLAKSSASLAHRVVVAGAGNTGKRSLSNRFLGEKVWPIAKCCMTSPICEALYGSVRGFAEAGQERMPYTQGIPKEAVNKSKQSDKDAFKQMASSLLQAWLPSDSLKSGVIQVDLPGFDQEKNYRQALEKYIEKNPEDRATMVYMLDVKNKILNSDREFLEFLVGSEWRPALQRVLLCINKCDRDDEGDEDGEEPPNYEDITRDITTEAKSYCQPSVYRLSLADAKRGQATAVEEVHDAMQAIDDAVSQQKGRAAKQAASHVNDVMRRIDIMLSSEQDRHRKLKDQKAAVAEAASGLAHFKGTMGDVAKEVSAEIRAKLAEERDHYRAAIGRREFSMEGQHETDENVKKFREEVAASIHVMVSNDLSFALAHSTAMLGAVSDLKSSFRLAMAATQALPACMLFDLGVSLHAGEVLVGFTAAASLASLLSRTVIAAFSGGVAWWFAPTRVITVDMNFKVFDEVYEKAMSDERMERMVNQAVRNTCAKFEEKLENETCKLRCLERSSWTHTPEVLEEHRATYMCLKKKWAKLCKAAFAPEDHE